MEKKRRARINDSLETLKQILLDSRRASGEITTTSANGKRRTTAKLEKADILEMTVTYLQFLKSNTKELRDPDVQKGRTREDVKIRAADSSSEGGCVINTLVPPTVQYREVSFLLHSTHRYSSGSSENDMSDNQGIWRPWG